MKKYKDVVNYSTGSKWLHWLVASIVLPMLAFSFFLGDLTDQIKPTAYMLHKSFGLTVLALMIIRIFWIKHTGRPPLPATVPLWEKRFSRLVQYSFYLFLILMPLAGWIMSTAANKAPVYWGLFKLSLPGISPNKALASFFAQCHTIIAWTLIALLVLHIAGACKHYFIDKDKVTQQMF